MWVFLDDNLWHNSKIRTFSPNEFRLWINCIAWCRMRRSVDGFISTKDVNMLRSAIADEPIHHTAIYRLVSKRGLDEREGGYAIHGYKEFYHSIAGKARAATAKRDNGRFAEEPRTDRAQTAHDPSKDRATPSQGLYTNQEASSPSFARARADTDADNRITYLDTSVPYKSLKEGDELPVDRGKEWRALIKPWLETHVTRH